MSFFGIKKRKSTRSSSQGNAADIAATTNVMNNLFEKNPRNTLEGMAGTFGNFMGDLQSSVQGQFDSMFSGMNDIFQSNDALQVFKQQAGDNGYQVDQSQPAPAPEPVVAPPPVASTPQQEQELSAYDQRINALMQNRGWTREEAIANQQNALKLGTDYNGDGAVTNDEWKKYEQYQQAKSPLSGVAEAVNKWKAAHGDRQGKIDAKAASLLGYDNLPERVRQRIDAYRGAK